MAGGCRQPGYQVLASYSHAGGGGEEFKGTTAFSQHVLSNRFFFFLDRNTRRSLLVFFTDKNKTKQKPVFRPRGIQQFKRIRHVSPVNE